MLALPYNVIFYTDHSYLFYFLILFRHLDIIINRFYNNNIIVVNYRK